MPAPKLLIIDDEKDIAELVSKVAMETGFQTRICIDYQKVREVYDDFLPDIVVLDVMMPNMDGFEVLEFLNERCSDSSIVLMSGQNAYRMMAEKMGTARGLTVVANFSKPFRIPQLRLIMQELMFEISGMKDSPEKKTVQYEKVA